METFIGYPCLDEIMNKMSKEKISESKKEKIPVVFNINRAIDIGGDLQEFFRKKRIEPMDAMLSMIILTEGIKRYLKLSTEDYSRLLKELEKVK